MAVNIRKLLPILLLCWSGSASAAFIDWWLTPDQQGRLQYERGEYQRAAQLFRDPMWEGLAYYAAQDFVSAAAMFATFTTAEGRFYLANAYAQQEQLAEAFAAYSQALEAQPDFPEASFNRDWVKGLLDIDNTQYDDAGGTGGKLAADKFVFSERANNAEQTMTAEQARAQGLSDEQLQKMWMRRVQTTPGDFLELKFAYQLRAEESSDE